MKSNRHIVGLVGLCNRILHTPVYRLLLFYIGNAMCIFKCPEGSGIPPYIIACVTENSYDCSLSMQSGSPSTFVLPSIFPGSFCRMYILIWQINCFIINLCFVDICFKSFCGTSDTTAGCVKVSNCKCIYFHICIKV